jgi:hypothetical protein
MEEVKNVENGKLTLLQNEDNGFRELGQNAENYFFNTLTS